MSIWKSPVFYLGIVLLIVVSAALAAPFVINWNGYRDNLESYGRKLTGRDVAINGPISVRLFPWPRLAAQDVSVGNPAGFSGPAVMNAQSINVELALAGLFGGEIRVESISVDRPIINVTRLADGRGNWVFEPDQVLRRSKLLDQVKLDQININDGVLHVQDLGHKYSNTLTGLNAVLSANALEGPWRVRGSVNAGAVALDIILSSSEWKNDAPFRFGVRLAPQDGSLPAFVFDGQQQAGELKGKIRLEPVITVDGRQSLEGSFKPLQMQADIKATFENIALEKIHITPADSKDSGTLIEGAASVALVDGVKVQLSLNSPRLDLDRLAGSQSLRVWRAGGFMAVLNGIMKDFPEKLDLAATLDVAALSAAGETIENVQLKAAAEQNAIRIQDFTANLPGRSRMKFNGIVFPGDAAAELGGTLALESNDTRQFVSWLWPEAKAQLVKIWTGNRGRLKAQSDVTWSGKRFAFQDLKYELDGETGDGELAVRLGALPAVDLRLNAKTIDLDNYLAASGFSNAAFLTALQSDNGFEKRLTLQSGKLRLNGVEAQDVVVDYASSVSGFEIKKMNVGSIEGARVTGQGLVLQGPDGPSGDIEISVNAENPRGLLRLLGVTAKGADPAWSNVLGVTDMTALIAVKPGAAEPAVSYDVTGQSGPLHISASGDVKDLAKGMDAQLGLSSEISSDNAINLLGLFGLRTDVSNADAGKLVVTAVGSRSAGFKTALDAELLGGKFGYEGQFKTGLAMPQLNGKILVSAKDGGVIGQAIGLPIQDSLAGELQFAALVSDKNGGLSFANINATLAGQNVSGEAALDPDGKLSVDLAMGSLDLRNTLAAAFMPWRGQTVKIDDAFSAPFLYPIAGEIWLRPTALRTGFGADLTEAVVGVEFDKTGRSLTIASRGADNEPFKFYFTAKPQGSSFAVSGSGRAGLDLAGMLHLQNGKEIARGRLILDGGFTGEGRSPLAALSSLAGNGTYDLRGARLTLISPQNFFTRLAKIKDAGELQLAFDSLLQAPGLDLSEAQQSLSVLNGSVSFQPVLTKTEGAEIRVLPSFDLADGTIVTDVTITPTGTTDLPAMRVTYSGEPGALSQRSDTSALSAKLGYAMIARDVAELDRMQKEQAKLVAEEEAQRKADEEKFAAYQAQRGELRLRQRELRVHAAQRLIDATQKKTELDRLIIQSQGINKREIAKFLRELKSQQAP
jgi:AsmA family/AsmA-like C-terminal region